MAANIRLATTRPSELAIPGTIDRSLLICTSQCTFVKHFLYSDGASNGPGRSLPFARLRRDSIGDSLGCAQSAFETRNGGPHVCFCGCCLSEWGGSCGGSSSGRFFHLPLT